MAWFTLLTISTVRSSEPQVELDLIARLDLPLRQAPAALHAADYYEVFDRDFAQGPVSGYVEVQALRTRDGREERVLESPTGDWTRHLSARLFRDELEVVPAEYEIKFTSRKRQGDHGSSVTVGKDSPVEASFTLSGHDGTSLEPANYRLWIMLDMREIPPAPGVFRGFAVNDAGAYYLHGEHDPAGKGGLVFRVREVGSDLSLKARSMAQREALEETKALAVEAMAIGPDDPPSDMEAGARHRRKVVEIALEGLQANPDDLELLVILARNYAVLQDCESAAPYMQRAAEIDPNAMWPNVHHNTRVQACLGGMPAQPLKPKSGPKR